MGACTSRQDTPPAPIIVHNVNHNHNYTNVDTRTQLNNATIRSTRRKGKFGRKSRDAAELEDVTDASDEEIKHRSSKYAGANGFVRTDYLASASDESEVSETDASRYTPSKSVPRVSSGGKRGTKPPPLPMINTSDAASNSRVAGGKAASGGGVQTPEPLSSRSSRGKSLTIRTTSRSPKPRSTNGVVAVVDGVVADENGVDDKSISDLIRSTTEANTARTPRSGGILKAEKTPRSATTGRKTLKFDYDKHGNQTGTPVSTSSTSTNKSGQGGKSVRIMDQKVQSSGMKQRKTSDNNLSGHMKTRRLKQTPAQLAAAKQAKAREAMAAARPVSSIFTDIGAQYSHRPNFTIDMSTIGFEAENVTKQLQTDRQVNVLQITGLALVDNATLQTKLSQIAPAIHATKYHNLTVHMSLNGIQHAFRALGHCNAEVLTLRLMQRTIECDIDINAITSFINSSPNLVALDVSETQWPDECLTAFIAAIAVHTSLSHVSFRSVELNKLSLALVEALHNNKHIQHLDLSNTNLGDVAVRRLIAVMQDNYSIESLFLDGNQMTPTTSALMFATLHERNQTLRALSIASTPLGDASVQHLTMLLQRQQLTYLDISYCMIGLEGLKHIAAALPNSGLRTLKLAGNTMGMGGTQLLLTALRKLQTLEELDLSENGIDHASPLIGLVHALPSLLTMHVFSNPLSVKGQTKLTAVLNDRSRQNAWKTLMLASDDHFGRGSSMEGVRNSPLFNDTVLKHIIGFAYGDKPAADAAAAQPSAKPSVQLAKVNSSLDLPSTITSLTPAPSPTNKRNLTGMAPPPLPMDYVNSLMKRSSSIQ